MKKTFFISALALATLLLTSCGKNCDSNPTCNDVVPTNEACLAYFERWFYDDIQGCVEIGYSGCSEYGFATQVECEECADCY